MSAHASYSAVASLMSTVVRWQSMAKPKQDKGTVVCLFETLLFLGMEVVLIGVRLKVNDEDQSNAMLLCALNMSTLHHKELVK